MELEWNIMSRVLIEAGTAMFGVLLTTIVLYLIAGRIWR
jgi:hypothetical protein